MSRVRRRLVLARAARLAGLSVAVLVCALAWRLEPAADRADVSPRWTAPAVQVLVDDIRARLGIREVVAASIVPRNPRAVSVASPRRADGVFRLAIERSFLDQLTRDELSAAVAHELGHVWASTHHPYLQTERLANEIAMRVVTRGSLERLYVKAWAREGTKGDLQSFLGS